MARLWLVPSFCSSFGHLRFVHLCQACCLRPNPDRVPERFGVERCNAGPALPSTPDGQGVSHHRRVVSLSPNPGPRFHRNPFFLPAERGAPPEGFGLREACGSASRARMPRGGGRGARGGGRGARGTGPGPDYPRPWPAPGSTGTSQPQSTLRKTHLRRATPKGGVRRPSGGTEWRDGRESNPQLLA